MRLATRLLTALLVLAALATAVLKLTGQPDVTDTLARVGVRGTAVVVIAVIELAGAIGLVVGWVARPRLAAAAASGLTLFFLGAVAAHIRVGDPEVAAPLLLSVLAATVACLHLRRIRTTTDTVEAPLVTGP